MLAISCCLVGNYAAADDEIKLPMHNLKDNVSLKTALEKRKTSRVFSRENLSTLDISNINELFISVSSGHLQHLAGRSLSDSEERSYRAQLIRERFKHGSGVM